jgi:hypothetical protein
LLAFIACIVLVVNKTIADDGKDYSWVSRIAEERDENNLKLTEKIKQRDELSKEIEFFQDRNKTITCKLNIGDRDATCEGL